MLSVKSGPSVYGSSTPSSAKRSARLAKSARSTQMSGWSKRRRQSPGGDGKLKSSVEVTSPSPCPLGVLADDRRVKRVVRGVSHRTILPLPAVEMTQPPPPLHPLPLGVGGNLRSRNLWRGPAPRGPRGAWPMCRSQHCHRFLLRHRSLLKAACCRCYQYCPSRLHHCRHISCPVNLEAPQRGPS